MTFAPIAPTTYVPPTKIANDTYVIHQVQPALGQPLFVYINSMVILGKEPVIVDTGTPANREAVAGGRVLARRARGRSLDLPVARRRRPHRQPRRGADARARTRSWCATGRWWNVTRTASTSRSSAAGGSCTASRSTSATGRCTRCVHPCSTRRRPVGCSTRRPACTGRSTRSRRRFPIRSMAIADLDPDFWFHGMWLFALGAVSPWLTMLDTDKYGKYVDRVQNLDITTIAELSQPGDRGPVHRAGVRPHPRAADARRADAAGSVHPRPDRRRNVDATQLNTALSQPFPDPDHVTSSADRRCRVDGFRRPAAWSVTLSTSSGRATS